MCTNAVSILHNYLYKLPWQASWTYAKGYQLYILVNGRQHVIKILYGSGNGLLLIKCGGHSKSLRHWASGLIRQLQFSVFNVLKQTRQVAYLQLIAHHYVQQALRSCKHYYSFSGSEIVRWHLQILCWQGTVVSQVMLYHFLCGNVCTNCLHLLCHNFYTMNANIDMAYIDCIHLYHARNQLLNQLQMVLAYKKLHTPCYINYCLSIVALFSLLHINTN